MSLSKKCLTQKFKKMVKIIGFKKRETEEGKEFFVLELQGGITMEKSKTTGKFYVTANKATISCTFDEQVCQALIGTEIEGKIEKVASEPYEYTVRETGEVIILSHRFEYVENEKSVNTTKLADKSTTTVEEFMTNVEAMDLENSFSKNGILKHS